MDIHIQVYSTYLFKTSVINMGTKLYNKLPGCIKGIDSYKTFKRNWNNFFFCIPFTQWKNVKLCNFISSVFNLSLITLFICSS